MNSFKKYFRMKRLLDVRRQKERQLQLTAQLAKSKVDLKSAAIQEIEAQINKLSQDFCRIGVDPVYMQRFSKSLCVSLDQLKLELEDLKLNWRIATDALKDQLRSNELFEIQCNRLLAIHKNERALAEYTESLDRTLERWSSTSREGNLK